MDYEFATTKKKKFAPTLGQEMKKDIVIFWLNNHVNEKQKLHN